MKPRTAYTQDIYNALYAGYGSDSGVLFGIPPEYKEAVFLIVDLAVDRALSEMGVPE